MANSFKLSSVFKGVLLAAAFAIIFSLIFGLLLSFTSLPESELAANIIYSVSVFLAAIFITAQTGNKGMFYGISIGIGFLLLLLIFTAVFQADSPSWIKAGEKAIFAVVAGGVGGTLGVFLHRV